MRATVASPGARLVIVVARWRIAASPILLPWLSLTRLKPSISRIASACGRFVRKQRLISSSSARRFGRKLSVSRSDALSSPVMTRASRPIAIKANASPDKITGRLWVRACQPGRPGRQFSISRALPTLAPSSAVSNCSACLGKPGNKPTDATPSDEPIWASMSASSRFEKAMKAGRLPISFTIRPSLIGRTRATVSSLGPSGVASTPPTQSDCSVMRAASPVIALAKAAT